MDMRRIIKVPSVIQVGGHTYSIVLSDSLYAGGDDASVNRITQRIQVASSLPASERWAGLIHEFLHAINNIYCHHSLNEQEIEGVSEGFNQIISQLGITLDWREIKHIK